MGVKAARGKTEKKLSVVTTKTAVLGRSLLDANAQDKINNVHV